MNTNSSENSCCPIRPFHAEDESQVVGVWYRAGIAAYTFLPTWQELTFDKAQWVFANIIRPKNKIWVGTVDERIVAFMAMNGSYIDRLYVDPTEWRKGWGTRLIDFAKQQSPNRLELHTHVENFSARAFYEHRGFKVIKFGISPPPESAPDVEYHWRLGEHSHLRAMQM